MPMLSDQILEEIKMRTDIVDLISQRVPLKRAGGDFKACCPFHNEHTPSFIVSPSRRSFHCFGCGAQGDVFKFLMLSEGLTFPESVKALAERCGVEIELTHDPMAAKRKTLIKIHNEVAGFFQRCLSTIKEAAPARAYLEKRGLDAETIEKFRIGYAPIGNTVLPKWAEKNGFDINDIVEAGLLSPPRQGYKEDAYYNKFRGRLMFPICDHSGQVIAFSGRILTEDKHAPKYYNSPETSIFRKSRVLYGLCFAKKNITKNKNHEVLVCEGQIDVIRCHSYGFGTAVASQGTAFTEEHVALLKPYADSALLVFDGDSAGLKAATRTGRLFLAAGMPVRVAMLPPGEDPDSFLRSKGGEAFQKLLDNPMSLAAFQIKAIRENSDNPTSIDTLARITDELFETFAACSKEILRSYLLQESAELLGIPLAAMTSDFEAHMQDQEKRRIWQERLKNGDVISNQAISSQSESADNQAVSLQKELEPTSAIEPTTSVVSQPKRRRFVESAALGIAEYLVKTSATSTEESEKAIDFIEKWVPMPILFDGPEKTIIEATLQDRKDRGNRLSQLEADGDENIRNLIEYLVCRKSPILASEQEPLEIIKDLISHLWIDYFTITRDNTDPSSTDGQNSRLLLSSAIRKLKSSTTWEQRAEILQPLL